MSLSKDINKPELDLGVGVGGLGVAGSIDLNMCTAILNTSVS